MFCSSCIRVSPPTEQRVELEEELRIKNDMENGNEEDNAVITKRKGVSDDNENGNDEKALETSASQEDIELVKTAKN